MTTRVQIMARCEADVTERWTFELPDGLALSAVEEAFNTEDFGGMRFVSVENVEVDNERDREVTHVEVVAS